MKKRKIKDRSTMGKMKFLLLHIICSAAALLVHLLLQNKTIYSLSRAENTAVLAGCILLATVIGSLITFSKNRVGKVIFYDIAAGLGVYEICLYQYEYPRYIMWVLVGLVAFTLSDAIWIVYEKVSWYWIEILLENRGKLVCKLCVWKIMLTLQRNMAIAGVVLLLQHLWRDSNEKGILKYGW